MSHHIDFNDFCTPPSGSRTASTVTKKEDLLISNVIEVNAAAEKIYNLDNGGDSIFDEQTLMMFTQYEYFRVVLMEFTMHFVGNWLKTPYALGCAYVHDRLNNAIKSDDCVRQQDYTLLKGDQSHKWQPKIMKNWRFCDIGVDSRLNSLGKLFFGIRPKYSSYNPGNKSAPLWRITLNAVVEFARPSVLTNITTTYSAYAWTGIYEASSYINFPTGDTRSAVIYTECKTIVAEKNASGFITFQFPIDFTFQVSDGTNTVTVMATGTSFNYTTTVDGKLFLVIPSNVGHEVDFTQFNIPSATSTLPKDYPFTNTGIRYLNIPTKAHTREVYTYPERQPQITYC